MSVNPQVLTQDEWNFWYGKIFGFFLRKVDSAVQADDLTSETLTDFFLKQREQLEHPQAFLFGIANNKLKMFYRSVKNNKEFSLNNDFDEIENTAISQSDEYLAKVSLLKNCIAQNLNAKDQEIIQLSVEEDFSSSELAKKLQMQPDNVRQRFSRAVRKIRQVCKEIWFNS